MAVKSALKNFGRNRNAKGKKSNQSNAHNSGSNGYCIEIYSLHQKSSTFSKLRII